MDRVDSVLKVGRLHGSEYSQTQSVPEYLMTHAIATYVGEVVISSYLACDNTRMHAGSVVIAHLIKLLLQLNK